MGGLWRGFSCRQAPYVRSISKQPRTPTANLRNVHVLLSREAPEEPRLAPFVGTPFQRTHTQSPPPKVSDAEERSPFELRRSNQQTRQQCFEQINFESILGSMAT